MNIMSKQKSVYQCQNCGQSFPAWSGQCSACGQWNTLVETPVSPQPRSARSSSPLSPINLSEVDIGGSSRVSTGIDELDRVLGGGLVAGQVVLLAGEPGVGKSTLLIKAAQSFGQLSQKPCLYVSGEESPTQVKNRAQRLGLKGDWVQILSENEADQILPLIKNDYCMVVVDSVQTLVTSDLSGVAGSIGQVKECSFRLSQQAKRVGVPLLLIGQITKEGTIAGPKTLEHLVDTVLTLEGDRFQTFRLLKSSKNRFGDDREVGVFEMLETGLEPVANPSDRFLSQRQANVSGSVVAVLMEGSRPMLLEIQALTAKTFFGYPRRASSGFPANRLLLLLAVLEKHTSLSFGQYDVYINIASGVRVSEPACDLAVCLALASSLTGKALGPKAAAFGEVGLSGEIRRVSQMDRRRQEAERMGYTQVISPEKFSRLPAVFSSLGLSNIGS